MCQEVTELTVEKSLGIFDWYSRPLTDIGGDSIGFGCEDRLALLNQQERHK